jgi:hypothetical protein
MVLHLIVAADLTKLLGSVFFLADRPHILQEFHGTASAALIHPQPARPGTDKNEALQFDI